MLTPCSRRLPLLALACSAALAQSPPPVQWAMRQDTEPKLAAAGQPWLPLLAMPTLSAGRYRLARGAVDAQTPHERDELYFVLRGKARLQAGAETRPVGAGDTIAVPAHVAHRFLDIEEDLDVLVFFSAARPATGGMAAYPPPTEQTPFPETSHRGNTRIFYWFGPDSAGQVAIDFGRPRWQAAFAKFVEQPAGRRWRLGENFWTTLDTNMALQIGGVDVAVGQYYCVLVNTRDGGPQLLLLDPNEARKQRLDAFEANKTQGGLAIPLQLTKAETAADELDLELTVDATTKDRGALTIRFGPYRLTTAVLMHPRRS